VCELTELTESELNSESEVRRDFKVLTEVLRDPAKRKKVEQLLQSFAGLDRSLLFHRISALARYLERICGKDALNALFSVITKAVPDVDPFLKMVDDEEIRRWLADLNSKYIPIYEGIVPRFPHDWYRLFWDVRVDVTHGTLPFMGLTLLKRNGETVHLDMPFEAVISLINHQLRQMKKFQEERLGAPPALGIRPQLEEAHNLINAILGGPTQQA